MDGDVGRGSFGPMLRRLRLEARITQEELAERAHLSVESIGALERGARRAPYRETVRLLSDALGLSEAQRREIQAAAGRRGPASAYRRDDDSAADPASVFTPHTNLPLSRTSLVGRDTEIRDISRHIQECRLVTVTGSGGVGKTRTALAVGDALLEGMADGVWLVELEPLAQGSSVTPTITRALGLKESPNRTLLETLLTHLKDKLALLIFDNCEHVIADAAAVADALLGTSPRLRILATSREPLRIAGEQTYRLPSLPIPPPGKASRVNATAVASYASVALFTQRAQAAERGFTLGDASAPIVAEICRRLDGIPLAIELAAARVNTLPVRALLNNLDQRLRFLNAGNRTALPRHQTMRALIDWSYDLLAPAEQRLFERLSIFAGGCDLEAAVAVCADAGDELSTLELLSSLVDKSLVVADLAGPTARYRLLESSRQHAAEKLAARGESTVVAHRHAWTYLKAATKLAREFDRASDSTWSTRAELELENWRSALHWTLDARGDVRLGQRLVSAMRPIWQSFWASEGRRWLRTALELVDDHTPAKVRADLEYVAAVIAYTFGEYEAALASSRRSVTEYLQLGEALEASPDQYLAGLSLIALGRGAEAEPLLQSALETARSVGNLRLAASALEAIATIRSVEGNFSEARAHFAEALEMYTTIDAERSAAATAGFLAEAEFLTGDVEGAIRAVSIALALLRNFGDTNNVTRALTDLAAYLIAGGRWDDARERAREALELSSETQQHDVLGWTLQHLVAVATLSPPRGDERTHHHWREVARLLGYIDARIPVLSTSRAYVEQQEYDRVIAELRDRIGLDAIAQFMAAGVEMSLEQAVTSALSLVERVEPQARSRSIT